MVVYACLVNGKDTGSRDFQSIEVVARDEEEVAKKIYKLKATSYKNTDGESVKWQLVDIYSCGTITSRPRDMEELSGFIAKKNELYGPPSLIQPTLKYLNMKRRNIKMKLA